MEGIEITEELIAKIEDLNARAKVALILDYVKGNYQFSFEGRCMEAMY